MGRAKSKKDKKARKANAAERTSDARNSDLPLDAEVRSGAAPEGGAPAGGAAPGEAALHALLEDLTRAITTGIRDGIEQHRELSSGTTYVLPVLSEAYDAGANLGQFIGQSLKPKRKFRARRREEWGNV
jgi:hypothetical protein